jgi:hypothetical protein
MSRLSRNSTIALTAAVLSAAGYGLFHCEFASHSVEHKSDVLQVWDPDVDGFDEGDSLTGSIASFANDVAPILSGRCSNCHGDKRPKGDFSLVTYPDDSVAAADRATWERVASVIRSRRMPPAGHPQLTATEYTMLTVWLDQVVVDPTGPGRVTLRRLNRTEYDNTIRDLVGIAFKPAADFPPDDSGEGFDTLGAVLSVSPTLVEKYLSAAEAIVETAAADQNLWRRISQPPSEEYIPFTLRGKPAERDLAVKGFRAAPADPAAAARAAEFDRAYFALQAFADRAYRRPVTHAEMTRLMRFVDDAVNHGDSTDAGLKTALKAVLVSPHFLFKIEDDLGQGRRLTDFELATRLSYFLWSSMPDEDLFRLAAVGKLSDARTLAAQVRRMLNDQKSRALGENFASQWLQTRALTEATRDPARFPSFDADLVAAMRTETELLFDHVVREDRAVTELLTADYTFANERLARHYGIAGVVGNDFRQVSLTGTGRRGVLTHGSVLTVTSGPARTSPVKRGKWVLENLLGTPVATPPPGVDTLKKNRDGNAANIREQFEQHRSRSECASCHVPLDPLGFGLEEFDSVGARRDNDGGIPINSSGTLPDGRRFRGASELVTALADRPDDFARCLTRKLLTYGLGRSLVAADRAAIERIVRHAAKNGYRTSSLIIALVRNDLFQMRRMRMEDLQ